jgi:predicted enzyme related to lactoylglutathione lyase
MVSRVVHFEIPADDPERAGAFYAAVFSWDVDRWGPAEYWNLSTGEPPGVGVEGAMSRRTEEVPGVVVYVGVDDLDAALDRVKRAGGTPLTEKMPIPAVGWSAHVRDTEANLIGLFQPDPDVTAAG